MARLYGKKVEDKDKVNIAGKEYTKHAEERMEDRHLMPSVVNNVMERPDEVYDITPTDDKGYVTKAYLKRGIADVNLESGKIGERIISVRDQKTPRAYGNVLILTDDDNVIRTVEVVDDKNLTRFIGNNARKRANSLEGALKVIGIASLLISLVFISGITGNAIGTGSQSGYGLVFGAIAALCGAALLVIKRR